MFIYINIINTHTHTCLKKQSHRRGSNLQGAARHLAGSIPGGDYYCTYWKFATTVHTENLPLLHILKIYHYCTYWKSTTTAHTENLPLLHILKTEVVNMVHLTGDKKTIFMDRVLFHKQNPIHKDGFFYKDGFSIKIRRAVSCFFLLLEFLQAYFSKSVPKCAHNVSPRQGRWNLAACGPP